MRFEEVYTDWQEKRLTQAEAARLLGVCERTFRRQMGRYEADGLDGLIDKRIEQISHRRAPVDEVVKLVELYRRDYAGWNVRHFHCWYRREHAGQRSYTWVKNQLQQAGEVKRAKARGKHRKKRERAPLPGMLVHQDASRHEWVAGHDWDLVVTLDDATGEHLSMFFCEEEGTASSFHGVGQTIACHGLFCALYTDRGSHYFHTPEAGGKVDHNNPTQFGRALAQLGIEHIAAYSPEARGRSERAFGTHQERLPRELAKADITDMQQANAYLQQVYMPRHNAEFAVPAAESGSAFVPYIGNGLADILCEHHERTVGNDNCVSFERLKLQIPADSARPHYVKRRVRVHRYVDGTLAVFYGPRCLGRYDAQGALVSAPVQLAA
ncbi:ISNCY family transposase [Burkholderia sp. ABCPW 14]|uniref:ISNCY family transposase n=2 Tax=unclassified Burkholderia TaxID=2613784 RepID=UPI00082A6B55|nr:ISNCY family transposase [Burkholderia sp. ABCPW 14]